MEGIHALNPELKAMIPDELKYRIYVSVLTSISLDNHNWIPTTDNRLLRRIIRDYRFRGYSARDTIARWPSVRRGEQRATPLPAGPPCVAARTNGYSRIRRMPTRCSTAPCFTSWPRSGSLPSPSSWKCARATRRTPRPIAYCVSSATSTTCPTKVCPARRCSASSWGAEVSGIKLTSRCRSSRGPDNWRGGSAPGIARGCSLPLGRTGA